VSDWYWYKTSAYRSDTGFKSNLEVTCFSNVWSNRLSVCEHVPLSQLRDITAIKPVSIILLPDGGTERCE